LYSFSVILSFFLSVKPRFYEEISIAVLLETMTADSNPEFSRSQTSSPAREPGRKLWQTALLLAASAAFGGLAVAFWNRKTLADIRNPEPCRRITGREDDIY